MKTLILPSARSIREKILEENSNRFLENYITIGEFLSRSVLVEGLRAIDEDTRTVLLLEAARFENFSKLQIERNFLSFTKNGSYIFGFFEELATENISIESLPSGDVYGEFEEHLEILQELRSRYKQLCLKHGYYDKIFLNEIYTINGAYLKTLGAVELHISGMLGNFELDILEKALQYVSITAYFEADEFNTKMQSRISERFGFEIRSGYRYELSLNEKKIVSKYALRKQTDITSTPLSLRSLQAAFVKERVAYFVKQGYATQKIAVVLPDESFAQILELFDDKNNFNFAMGSGFEKSYVYQKLHATLEALLSPEVKHMETLQRYGGELYDLLLGNSGKKVFEVDLEEILEQIAKACRTKEERQIFDEERFLFLKLGTHIANLNLASALRLFLSRLGKRSFDDVGGGKVTVMGLLETRGVEFDAVIVCDFNDAYVPKRMEKDMFLNSTIKERAGLPTRSEREELQKHMYATLFRNAKEVALCYVESSTQMVSRFTKELGNVAMRKFDEKALASLLLPSGKVAQTRFEPFEMEYDFTKERVSNSKLKTYLECTRKFYLRYIKRVENFEIPTDLPQEWEIGNTVHAALKNLYEKQSCFDSAQTLCEALWMELERVAKPNVLERFQVAMYKELLKRFCQNEIKRFAKGYKVYKREEEIERVVEGMKLYGVVDRIDITPEATLEVLDYKTGSYKLYTKNKVEQASDFQLEFYYLLAQKFGEVSEVGFYDLQKGKIVDEAFMEQKLEVLRTHLRKLAQSDSIEVAMCEDAATCRYCEYKTICGRD